MLASILEKIRHADSLPTSPSVARQMLQLNLEPEVSVRDVALVIQQDPALTGKVLRIANSPLFGQVRRIASLPQAMVILGLRTVKILALSFSLVEEMSEKADGIDLQRYWRRSLTTAVAARLLAMKADPQRADDAFVAGLLCDIGVLAASQYAPAEYAPVLQQYNRGEALLQTIERAALGDTHETLSEALLDIWGLPQVLCQAVGRHHCEDPAAHPPAEDPLAVITRAAAGIADIFCEKSQSGRLQQCKERISGSLGLDKDVLDQNLEKLDQHLRHTASLFAADIGDTRTYAQLQAEAAVQLARISMSAELERVELARREAAVREQLQELNRKTASLQRLAMTDALTGVANRAAFEARLAQECREAAANHHALSLVMLDIDRFKKLNDTFGHQIGDEALRLVGGRLSMLEDDNTFTARYGGEEFAIILTGHSLRDAQDFAESLRQDVQRLRINHAGARSGLTASVGVGFIAAADSDLNPRQLVQHADQCLYHAKQAGRNRVILRELQLGAPTDTLATE